MNNYPRNLKGYGGRPPQANWPNGARLALQFVLNYEEGGENNILHGDPGSESFLSEIIGTPAIKGARHMSMESVYEYGSRAGVWRLLDLFSEYELPLTAFVVASALERYPEIGKELMDRGHEICSHGYKWIDYQFVSEPEEAADMDRAFAAFESVLGTRPVGWYTGRTSPNTKRLTSARPEILYSADDYSDDLPFWEEYDGNPLLVVPYTLDANDMRFATLNGFANGEDFFIYLKDSFDYLYTEGEKSPKMMSVGLHCRLAGRPGRTAGLKRFMEYVRGFDGVWICRRDEIARHWQSQHPYKGVAKERGRSR